MHHHDHEHEHHHAHTHEHTHDGHTHSHEHTHSHTHDHEHPHDHDHLHEAGREHHHHHHDHDHAGTPMEELLALMKYMVGHNAAHAKELADLAHQLAHAGSDTAYDKVMTAVAKFDEGNAILTAILDELGAEQK